MPSSFGSISSLVGGPAPSGRGLAALGTVQAVVNGDGQRQVPTEGMAGRVAQNTGQAPRGRGVGQLLDIKA